MTGQGWGLERAACTFRVKGEDRVQLLPAGDFRGVDGRPSNLSAWRIDQRIAKRLIAAATNHQTDFVIDWEHATETKAPKGEPAPAAGWFRSLEWVGGKGLFATGVAWTEKAREQIKTGAYRYISPVFHYNKHTGEVVAIVSAGLTNTPNLGMLDELTLREAASQASCAAQATTPLSPEDQTVCRLLGISHDHWRGFVADEARNSLVDKAGNGMTHEDRLVADAMGINHHEFANQKRREGF